MATRGVDAFFSHAPIAPMLAAMDPVTLPPDLQRFAEEEVAAGRFRNLSEVAAAGVNLLRRAEAERAAFIASLEAAEAEADRDGWLSLDDVLAEMDDLAAKRDAA
jgi:putative addiction module CopG family antidote